MIECTSTVECVRCYGVCSIQDFYKLLMSGLEGSGPDGARQLLSLKVKAEVDTYNHCLKFHHEVCHEAITEYNKHYNIRMAWYPHKGFVTVMLVKKK